MRRRLVAVAMALTLVAGACGSDDEGELGSAGAEVATDGQTAADDSTDDAASSDGDDQAITGDSGSSWCDAVRSAAEDDTNPLDFDLFTLSPDEIVARFQENVAELERWQDQAPPEIDSQVGTLVDAFRTLSDKVDEADGDLLSLGNDPEFLATFDAPELEAAANDIDAYSRDVCGVDLGADLGGDAGAPDVSVPPVGGGEDAATQLFEQFGLPLNFLTEDQLACVNAEIAAVFPDGLPADLLQNEEAFAVLDAINTTCDIAP
ncbi:MAG: hypothetical protein AAGA93_10160 [Actinomycetota bacterium]